jgi:hypothetical protein
MLRLEPVPAERRIGALALAWIGNEKSMLLSQGIHARGIHARACCEVIDILRAAMQHDDQWTASAGMMTARNIEFVASPSGGAGIGPAYVLSAIGDLERLARPDARQTMETEARKPGPTERRGAA